MPGRPGRLSPLTLNRNPPLGGGGGSFLDLSPPLPLHIWLYWKISLRMAFQMVREEGRDRNRILIFRPSICLGGANPPSSPGRLPATPTPGSQSPFRPPGELQVHRQMPFPSWPAVKPVSWWLCVLPRDLGQMVPVTIHCHSAVTGSSLTRVHVRPRWGPRAWYPAFLSTCCPISPRGSTPPHRSCQHSTHLRPQTSPRGRPLSVLAEKMKAHGTFPSPSRLWGLNDASPRPPHHTF